MQYLPPALEALTEQFAKLPGIGTKTAQRLAFYILNLPDGEAGSLRQCHPQRQRHHHPLSCLSEPDPSGRGSAPCAPALGGIQSTICVVADPKDVIAMERARRVPGVATMCSTGSSPP